MIYSSVGISDLFDPWPHDLQRLELELKSTLYSSSLWRTDTTIFPKFNKPPPFQISIPLSLLSPPQNNVFEKNKPRGVFNRGFTRKLLD